MQNEPHLAETHHQRLRKRQRQALEASAGCWIDESHPHLRTEADVAEHLRRERHRDERRRARLRIIRRWVRRYGPPEDGATR